MNRPPVVLVLAVALACAPAVAAQTVVVPNSLVSVEGNSNNAFPWGVTGGMRWQQVFNANQFAGPLVIGQITFRPDADAGFAFNRTLSAVQISLSTTANGPNALSPVFANNLGGDNAVVYSGSLTLSSANTAGPGNTRAFDVVIDLQTPFSYNPAGGHLLLDVLNSSPEDHSFQIVLDAENNLANGFVSRVFGPAGDPGATSGSTDPNGFVTRFTAAAVPEPATLALVGVAGFAAAAWRRRRNPSAPTGDAP
jgi:hypothetical protein